MTAMEAALNADVDGIDGECGGAGICGTCHVWVDAGWDGRLPPAGQAEVDMLDAFENRLPTSRLSCQIQVSAAMSGLVLIIPDDSKKDRQ